MNPKRRVRSIEFFPRAVPFSSLEPYQEPGAEDVHDEADVERQIAQMLYSLGSDKERCVFFYMLLREYGFKFDHEASAKSLHINWRWYMRVREKVQQKLQALVKQR